MEISDPSAEQAKKHAAIDRIIDQTEKTRRFKAPKDIDKDALYGELNCLLVSKWTYERNKKRPAKKNKHKSSLKIRKLCSSLLDELRRRESLDAVEIFDAREFALRKSQQEVVEAIMLQAERDAEILNQHDEDVGSLFESIVGQKLPEIFNRHFKHAALHGRGVDHSREGLGRPMAANSPYIRFALATCEFLSLKQANGDSYRPDSVLSAIKRVKKH